MLETPHVAVGAAIALKIPNPFIAVPLSLASHFVLDTIPHWNPHTYSETKKYGRPTNGTILITMVDIAMAFALGIGVAKNALPDTNLALTIIACSAASVFPDVSKYPFFMFKSLRKGLYERWVKYERSLQVEGPFWLGALTQVLVTIAALRWIS